MCKLSNFTCQKCSSNQLSFEKWIQSREEVVFHPNRHIEYCQAEVNEEKDLGGMSGFVCGTCGNKLCYLGCRIETEKELIDWLCLDPQERQEREKEYQECLDVQAEEEQKRQSEVVETYSVAEEG